MVITRKGLLLEEDEIKVAPIAGGSMMEFQYGRIGTLIKASSRIVYDATSENACKIVKEISKSGIKSTPLMIITSLLPDIQVELIKSSERFIDMWKNETEHHTEAEEILGASIRAYTELTGRAVLGGKYINTGEDTFDALVVRNIAYEMIVEVSINRIEIPVQAIVNVIERLKEKGYYIQYIKKSIGSTGNYKIILNTDQITDENDIMADEDDKAVFEPRETIEEDDKAVIEAIETIGEAFNEMGIKINGAWLDPTCGNPF